jgi:mRNA interferase MazF
VAAGGGYGGKPRPAVVVQSDDFPHTGSVTVCLVTSRAVDAPILRPSLEAVSDAGLAAPSWAMVDKLVTVPRSKVGDRIGRLAHRDMRRLERSLLVFLGLAE